MALINNTDLETQLQSKVDSISTGSNFTDFLIPELLTSSSLRSTSVADVAALPDIYLNNIPTGQVVFVESLGIHVISNNGRWLGFDGRLLRRDAPAREVWSWGLGSSGQLGDTTVVSKSSPVSVVGGCVDWCQVSAGNGFTAAVRTNGTLWAWGAGLSGRLGDGFAANRTSPVSVVGGFTNWCQVSAGGTHTAAVRTDGSIWAWGDGICGRLGDNTILSKSSPVSVVGGFTDWCRVSAGRNHTVALRTNGTLWSWGLGTAGQLGNGTTVNKSSPVSVVGGFTDWCQVSAAPIYSVAVRTNGTLWAWGSGTFGSLGSYQVSNGSPVSVIGGFTDWCQVSATDIHTVAVRNNGSLWAWGYGTRGQLGDGFAANRTSPVSVVGGFTDWCQAIAGSIHTVALRTNGTLWAWGSGLDGLLGDGTVVCKSSPVQIVGGFTDWCQVSAEWNHTAAIREYQ